jgi:hypothetical protein
LGAIGAAVIATIAIQAQEVSESPFGTIGEERYYACGLHKLTEAEQGELLSVFCSAPGQNFLRESAFRYLEEKGWERVQILGLIEVNQSGEDYYALASYHGRLYTLDPNIVPYMPDPGLYWADITGSSWTLLYPNGETGGFWERDLD